MTQIVSDSLDIEPFRAMTELQPMQTQHQEYTADSSSDSSTSWFINAPGSGALLYNEAYIEYNITFTGTANNVLNLMFAQGALSHSSSKLGFRQGFAMIGAMQAISCNINGTVINEQPDRWNHELFRFYSTPNEQNSICTLSGGEADTGTCNFWTTDDLGHQSRLANANISVGHAGGVAIYNGMKSTLGVTDTFRDLVPIGKQGYNEGFDMRWARFKESVRHGGFDPTNNSGAPNVDPSVANALFEPATFTMRIFERVPVAPFMLYELRDERRSIPNIDRLELVISWNANARNMFLQGKDAGRGVNSLTNKNKGDLRTQNVTVDFAEAKFPKLHLRWYMPPSGFIQQMPREISIPITELKYDTRSFPSLVHDADKMVSETKTETYNNIRLEQIPDMMYIYVKPDPSKQGLEDPSEFHCEIIQLDISVDGDSGKLLRANTAQLFAMYVRNAANRNMIMPSYADWRKRYCCAAIKPEDLGLRHGPGVNHPVTFNVNIDYRSWWNHPQLGQGIAPDQPGFRDGASENRNLWSRNDNYIIGNGGAAGGLTRTPQVFIISEYKRYELTINSAGGSRRKLLALAPPSVAGVPALAPEQIGLAGLV